MSTPSAETGRPVEKPAVDDGGPAFPVGSDVGPASNIVDGGYGGMSLRDYFAAKAMHAIIRNDMPGRVLEDSEYAAFYEDNAIGAYAMADAMLSARKSGGAL